MADPFSIIAGVLGITTAVVQASKTILQLLVDTARGPEEVRSISHDIHAFQTVVISLKTTIGLAEVQNAIAGDETLLKTIVNLDSPLRNCRVVLEELMVKLKQQHRLTPLNKRFRINTVSLRWSLFTKSEVRALQCRLEAGKATLSNALNAISA